MKLSIFFPPLAIISVSGLINIFAICFWIHYKIAKNYTVNPAVDVGIDANVPVEQPAVIDYPGAEDEGFQSPEEGYVRDMIIKLKK